MLVSLTRLKNRDESSSGPGYQASGRSKQPNGTYSKVHLTDEQARGHL